MTIHHTKHHKTYVDNLNATEAKVSQAIADGKQLTNWVTEGYCFVAMADMMVLCIRSMCQHDHQCLVINSHYLTMLKMLNYTHYQDSSRLYFWYICISGDISTAISLEPAMKFNGGGHINHSVFWTNLSPQGGGVPKGRCGALGYGVGRGCWLTGKGMIASWVMYLLFYRWDINDC